LGFLTVGIWGSPAGTKLAYLWGFLGESALLWDYSAGNPALPFVDSPVLLF